MENEPCRFSVHPVGTWNALCSSRVSATSPSSSVFPFVSHLLHKSWIFRKTHEKKIVQQPAENGSSPSTETITILIGTGSPCCSQMLKISQGWLIWLPTDLPRNKWLPGWTIASKLSSQSFMMGWASCEASPGQLFIVIGLGGNGQNVHWRNTNVFQEQNKRENKERI